MKLIEGKVTREELAAMGDDGKRLARRCLRGCEPGDPYTILSPELAMLRDRMQAWAQEIARSAPAGVRLDDFDGMPCSVKWPTENSATFEIRFYIRAKDMPDAK